VPVDQFVLFRRCACSRSGKPTAVSASQLGRDQSEPRVSFPSLHQREHRLNSDNLQNICAAPLCPSNAFSYTARSRFSPAKMLSSLTRLSVLFTLVAGFATPLQQPSFDYATLGHPIPRPEPIEITSIPLPPVVDPEEPGACSYVINSHGTGCIGQSTGLQAGTFLPDGNHILVTLRFAGAPAASDPRNVYDGQHLVILKADATVYSNGDTWKCLTCGVPDDHAIGLTETE
jgi:hypothetical protein